MSDPDLSRLPAVHALMAHPSLAETIANQGRVAVLQAVRQAIDESREALRRGDAVEMSEAALVRRARRCLALDRPFLRPVLNATGVLLHTGLGRAPLAGAAISAIAAVARGFSSLEFDLVSGRRGGRTGGVEGLLRHLTGAEAATVVNNNAAATILALRAVANGREVVVSRGELVEIGGSFRLPEIFEVSGARLREVGTTNKTRLDDYRAAIGPDTAALLRVHPSNYRIVGFTESVEIGALCELARARGLICIDDIGSGAIGPGCPPGVEGEPTMREGLEAGADLVLSSGDKLLGGPQCGLIVGRRAVVDRLTSDPLMRAFRVDKLTLAALEATLRLMRDQERAAANIPLWVALTTPVEELHARAERLADAWRADPGLAVEVVPTTAYLGGGSTPYRPIESVAVRLTPPFPGDPANEGALAARLRAGDPAVVGRVHQHALLLDLRAIAPGEDPMLETAVRRAARSQPGAEDG